MKLLKPSKSSVDINPIANHANLMDKFADASEQVKYSRSYINKQEQDVEDIINRFVESINDPMLGVELQSETAKGILGLKEKTRNGLTDS